MTDRDRIEAEIGRLMKVRNQAARDEQVAREGRLEARTTTEYGKTYTRFYGDAAAAWSPFMPPVRNRITGFDRTGGR